MICFWRVIISFLWVIISFWWVIISFWWAIILLWSAHINSFVPTTDSDTCSSHLMGDGLSLDHYFQISATHNWNFHWYYLPPLASFYVFLTHLSSQQVLNKNISSANQLKRLFQYSVEAQLFFIACFLSWDPIICSLWMVVILLVSSFLAKYRPISPLLWACIDLFHSIVNKRSN